MIRTIVPIALAAALAALGGCTLMTNFDPEGQPCDLPAPEGQQCLPDAGYFCDHTTQTCRKASALEGQPQR